MECPHCRARLREDAAPAVRPAVAWRTVVIRAIVIAAGLAVVLGWLWIADEAKRPLPVQGDKTAPALSADRETLTPEKCAALAERLAKRSPDERIDARSVEMFRRCAKSR